MKSSKGKLNIRELILFGILGAMTFALKLGMAWLPNIEPVSLCILVYGVVFGRKALYPTYIYVAMEILYFGLGIWNFCYLYIWALLVLAAIFLREMQQPLGWALVSGVYGLLFGALCSIPYGVLGAVDGLGSGLRAAFAWWVAGIPFDLIHGVANFALMLVLYRPMRRAMEAVALRVH